MQLDIETGAQRFTRTPNSVTRRKFSESQFASVAGWVFFLGLAVVLALPLVSKLPWMIFVQDDFLYYLKVAQSIAHGHGSSFNSIVPTNGYQPLWLLVLVGLSWFTENSKLILLFLAVTDLVAAIVTFFLARKLIRIAGVRPLLVFALSAMITLYSVSLFFYGMEVTLAVPLVLGVSLMLLDVAWLERSATHTFALGLLLSLMVLARIDTLILGGLLLAGIVLSPSLRRLLQPRLVLGAVLGMAPLAGYFLLNHFLFQTWLPVSGMAKELRLTHLPSIEPWRVFFHPLAATYATLMLAALLLLPRISSKLTPMARVVFPSLILFPFVYYFILSCVSDWTLWGWYMYPLRTAICISFLVFCLYAPIRRVLERPVVTGLLLVLVFCGLAGLRWTRQQTDIYAASVELEDFARSHPGTYAMGDRAGRVAYLIPYPVVQTEGLMMDRSYLNFIKQQTPLRDVLAHYQARYYVATAYSPFAGCFHAVEPAKAGPTSAKMRAVFCEAPLATHTHDGIETLVFDLQKKN